MIYNEERSIADLLIEPTHFVEFIEKEQLTAAQPQADQRARLIRLRDAPTYLGMYSGDSTRNTRAICNTYLFL